MNQEQESKKYVHVLENYYMTTDDHQYILKKQIVRKAKNDSPDYTDFVQVGYYSSLSSLVTGCLSMINRDHVAEGKYTEIKDCIQNYMNYQKQILALLDA